MCLFCGSSGNGLVSVVPGEGVDVLAAANGAGVTSVTASSNQDINGLLYGVRWTSLNQTFGFPTSGTQYGNYEHQVTDGGITYTVDESDTFQAFNANMQNAARTAFGMVNELTGIQFTENTSNPGGATIRLGITDEAQPTAYAYYPATAVYGGDVWMGSQTSGSITTNPVLGNYAYLTHLHEIGHALGLKHGHETGGVANVAMTSAHDAMEFSIMTYRAYVGDPLTGLFTNEQWGYAQSFMMYDIAALQYMYGADFGTRAGNTVYSFDPNSGQMFIDGVGQGTPGGNRIFRTVWDGNGTDTYDLSNYANGVSINLAPGSYSVFSTGQLANLGNGNFAKGNVYNALQYNSDARSLIENATGGAGNDSIVGNAANNTLIGGEGADSLEGGAGADVLLGGGGNDLITFDNLDQIDGGGGFDFVTAFYSSGAIDINVTARNVEGVYGSAFNDRIDGVGLLVGGEYYGYDGNDTIIGSSGANLLHGGAGDDLIIFDFRDNCQGGAGFDFATAYLSDGGINISTTGLALEGVYGSVFNDIINASTAEYGGGFWGYEGNDVIWSSREVDQIHGGNGFDYATYGGAWQQYTWNRVDPITWTVRDNVSGVVDTLIQIEVLRFANGEVVL